MRDYRCGDCDDRNSDAGPDIVSALEGADYSAGFPEYRSRMATETTQHVPLTATSVAWKRYKSREIGFGSVAKAIAVDAIIFGVIGGYVILRARLRK